MHLHPILPLAALAPVLAALFLAGHLDAAQGHTRDEPHAPGPAAIGPRYRAQCATCHTAPDARFETDRAWLGRIPETT